MLFVIFVGRKNFYTYNLSNKAEKSQNSQNYYLKLENYNEGQIRITEAYYKEEKSLITITSYSKRSR